MYNKLAMIELKKILLNEFPENIEKLILFGSRAENKETEFSDYDILVILRKSVNRKLENAIYDLAYDIVLKYDILTDLKLISKDELNSIHGHLPYVQSALKKGVVL